MCKPGEKWEYSINCINKPEHNQFKIWTRVDPEKLVQVFFIKHLELHNLKRYFILWKRYKLENKKTPEPIHSKEEKRRDFRVKQIGTHPFEVILTAI